MLDVITQSEILSTSSILDGRRDWPEGAIYRYDRGGHELLRIVRDLTKKQAAALAREPVELALVVDGPLVVMCSRVGEVLPWAGAAYHWHRVGRADRVLPISEFDKMAGSKLALMLMEGQGGRVRAVRPLDLPADFTRVLFEAILEQSRFNYDPKEERRAMDSLLRRCPTPGSLVGYSTVKARLTS